MEQELPNPVQTPKRRGRPPRVAEPPEMPVEHKAPVAVTVRFKAGAVDTFGCVGWKISGPFFIFWMPEAGGYLQKTIYLQSSEIASLTVIQSPQQQPQAVPEPVAAPPMDIPQRRVAPPPPSGPVVYEARKVFNELKARNTSTGPESQVIDEHGNLVTVSAGFSD